MPFTPERRRHMTIAVAGITASWTLAGMLAYITPANQAPKSNSNTTTIGLKVK